jgi:hypothetical protein
MQKAFLPVIRDALIITDARTPATGCTAVPKAFK